MRSFLRLLVKSVVFMPFGWLMALAAPHADYPLWQWFLLGGALSWGLAALTVVCLLIMPATNTNCRVYARPWPGGGTVLTLAGALVPLLILWKLGQPIFPWAQATLAAAFLSVVAVLIFELLTWARVELKDDGFCLETLFQHHYLLYGEILPGPSRKDVCCPAVVLRRGGHFRLPNHLTRYHKDDSMADRVFGPFLAGVSRAHNCGRGTDGLVRTLSLAASKAEATPIDPDTSFFLAALEEKSSLGLSFLFWSALGAIVVLLELAGAQSGYFSLWPLRHIPSVIADVIAPVVTIVAPLISLLICIYAYCWLASERARSIYLKGVDRTHLGKEKKSEPISDMWKIQGFAILFALAWFFFHTNYSRSIMSFERPGRVTIGVIAVFSILCLAYKAIRYGKGEKAALNALLDGSPTAALKLLEAKVPSNASSPWQCFKAYALAIEGKKLKIAMEMARRDLIKMAAPITFGSCCLAAARIKQMNKEEKSARAIAKKLLLRFDQLLSGDSFVGRLGFEARQIVGDESQE